MKRFRDCKRGQFVILAAVIIAAFMFSLVLTVSQISTSRQEVAYEPVDESVLAITSDFERCLTRALANATKTYYDETEAAGSYERAELSGEAAGNNVIEGWLRAALEIYSGFGVNIYVAPPNSTGKNADWEIEWGERNGTSAVYATFSMDIEAYGLRGLTITLQKVVRLSILDVNIESTSTGIIMTMKFKVWEEGKNGHSNFIVDLTPNNLRLLVNEDENVNYSIIDFAYIGQGVYRVQFNLDNLIADNITLLVTTNDGIKVAARLGLCVLSLMSNNLATGIENEGTFIVNGTELPLEGQSRTLLLLQGQTLNIIFMPPPDSIFVGFSYDGPIDIETNGSSAMVKINGSGWANITAVTDFCYITFMSQEDNGPSLNLGTFNLMFPDGALVVLGDDEELPKTIPVPYNQTLTITYEPASGYMFRRWTTSSPDKILIESTDSPSTEVIALGNGIIMALYYNSSTDTPPAPGEPPVTAPSTCYITFRSREYDNINLDRGTFLLIFPNGTLYIFVDDVTSETLEEISETLEEIGEILGAELDINLLDLVNGSLFTLKVLPINNFPVPYNQTLRIIYIPRPGYIFRSWETSNTILVKKTISFFGIFSYMRFIALGNGTITAVYDGSRPIEWRVLYISPEKGDGGSKKDSFVLELVPELLPEQVTPPLNNPHDKRSGNTTKTTPTLYLGKNIVITLYAKYTKQGSIDVKVTLGFYTSDGAFYEIGGGTITVPKSLEYIPRKITFEPSIEVIPEGSRITLVLERMDNDSGGTLHILCGLLGSKIELWQPWE
ncbi:MAG: hypothetical protein QXV75_05235 [Candidatus Bathyarchaeia archaeon]